MSTAPSPAVTEPVPAAEPADPAAHVDVAIVGSGFSGLAMAVRLRQAGMTDFAVLERGDDVGGTWRDNSYPGCRCDVPSHVYSFSFAPNPNWSSTFSPQAEIWAYLRDVAHRFGVREHVRLRTEVLGMTWDEERAQWRLETSGGPLTARVLVAAPGALSEPAVPALPGLERFRGTTFHSATWDHDHDLAGERVAVVGTGASAIQFVPEIQPRVGRLHVFQRTAPWIMPRRERPLTEVERRLYRRVPGAQRAMRTAIAWARELFHLPMRDRRLARLTRSAGLAHLKRQVPDPELRRRLTPDYAPGCKRILISDDYLPALGRPNVEVVTDGITEVRERSVVTADGTEREVDTIIFGTGFHVTDFPIAGRIRGRRGRTLKEAWADGMSAHKGTAVAGFPNLFLLLGPNTGLGHTSVVLMAEAQVDYVVQALRHEAATGTGALEVRPEAQAAWNAEVQARMPGTVWNDGGCSSWYLDEQGRNTTLWPDFVFRFVRAVRHFDPLSYRPATPAIPATDGTPAAANPRVAA